MSPNTDTAAEELPFVPGQIIKVFGEKDSDGFYHGESGGLSGFVPSNLVAEIPVDDEYLKHLLMQQGFLPVDYTDVQGRDSGSSTDPHWDLVQVLRRMPFLTQLRFNMEKYTQPLAFPSGLPAKYAPKTEKVGMSLTPDLSDVESIDDDVVVRRMVALFDYDPWENSPNIDSEAELEFRAGDIIYVLGDMDQDGFYCGDLHGVRGLVPSNFLQPLPWN